MLRQAVALNLVTCGPDLVAVHVAGFSCAEHQHGMFPFAKLMGLKATPQAFVQRRPLHAGGVFRRRVARLDLPGARALALGAFAGAHPRTQVGALVDSPAPFERWYGPLGRMRNMTPLAVEEPFMDLLVHSDAHLCAIWDDANVVFGAGSPRAQAVLDWVERGLASGDLRLIPYSRAFVLALPQAALDLHGVDLRETAPPAPYVVERLRCTWRAPVESAAA